VRLRADQKLFLSYLVLIAGLTLGTSLGAEGLLRRHLLQTIESSLRRELLLGLTLYQRVPGLSPDSIAEIIAERTDHRVTIIDVRGRVIGESSLRASDRAEPQDYRSREEVAAALRFGEGRAIRRSATLGTEHLYYAARTNGGEIIRLAVPLDEIDRAMSGVQRGIHGLALVAILIAALFSLGFSVAITRPLRTIGESARALAAGDLSRRTRVRRPDELGDLARALDMLADELQRRIGQLEKERTEMQTLIDAMAEGVLALAPNGRLRRANPAARRFFALGAASREIPAEMISRRPEFLEIVERVLQGRKTSPRELSDGARSFLLTAQPLPDGGAVLVVLDTSELRRLEAVRRHFVANASHELKTPLTAIRGFSET
jgi:two-component system phosphate regulon sensor histidine kinase PhoR